MAPAFTIKVSKSTKNGTDKAGHHSHLIRDIIRTDKNSKPRRTISLQRTTREHKSNSNMSGERGIVSLNIISKKR